MGCDEEPDEINTIQCPILSCVQCEAKVELQLCSLYVVLQNNIIPERIRDSQSSETALLCTHKSSQLLCWHCLGSALVESSLSLSPARIRN